MPLLNKIDGIGSDGVEWRRSRPRHKCHCWRQQEIQQTPGRPWKCSEISENSFSNPPKKITQVDLFLFVFWKKSKTPKKRFEINWPLWISSNPYIFMIWDHLLQKQEKRDLYIMALKYWMQPKCHLTKKFHITLSIFPSTTFMINRLHFNLIERVL